MKVLTYNYYCRPKLVFNDSQNKRIKLLSELKEINEYDVILFQELFDNSSYKLLKNIMKDFGFIYKTKRTGKKNLLMNGGGVIFSKYPIEKQSQLIFPPGQIFNSMSNKGTNYAKVLIDKDFYHILNVHLDSFSPKIRKQQLKMINNWMEKDLNIKSNEKCIIGGDFNICFHTKEMNSIKELNGFTISPFNFNDNNKWSCDNKNDWSIRRTKTVNDKCLSLSNKGEIKLEKNEHLDFFVIKNIDNDTISEIHKYKSNKEYNTREVLFSTPFYFNIYNVFKKKNNMKDLSDHYAVSITF